MTKFIWTLAHHTLWAPEIENTQSSQVPLFSFGYNGLGSPLPHFSEVSTKLLRALHLVDLTFTSTIESFVMMQKCVA